MANPAEELELIREGSARKILRAIQAHRGTPRGSWHEQNVTIRTLTDTTGGWEVTFLFVEDEDNTAQYDKSVEWEGEAVFRGTPEGAVEMTGSCRVTVVGVASDAQLGTTLTLKHL